MALERKSTGELQEHMLWSYYGLRVGLAAIGVALPLIVLFAGGILHHVWLEPSLSRYYHTESRLPFLTTRDLFVGGLIAAGFCLYLYKGFSNKENVALNFAGVFAVLVALLPTSGAGNARTLTSVLHDTSAVLFFFCIAYVSLFRARDTIDLLPIEKRQRYLRLYFCTGLALVVSPLAAVVLSFTLDADSRTFVFWAESLTVWTFSAYWIIKTFEMRKSDGEKLALDAELEREVVPAVSTQEAGPVLSKRRPQIFRRAETAERVVRAKERSAPVSSSKPASGPVRQTPETVER
jgi:hypothetical protein